MDKLGSLKGLSESTENDSQKLRDQCMWLKTEDWQEIEIVKFFTVYFNEASFVKGFICFVADSPRLTQQ